MATALPIGFTVTDEMKAWAELKVPSVNIEIENEKFVDFWRGNGRRMADWPAVWRNWMRRAPSFRGAALRSPDEIHLLHLMREYTGKGFRRAYVHESSFTYSSAFHEWGSRDLPQRDISPLLKLVKRA